MLTSSTLGQYRVRGKIGTGGMGDVYDAIHTSLDKRVAIKTLRRRFLDDQVVVARFLREGQLASRMRHPHIVDVTDVGVIDELPCLVMEHLEGETLGQVIRRDGALKPSALVDVLLPILAAVDFAHDHGVLHRDLKPSNIFLARSWNGEVFPKVLDFGISKLVHEDAGAALTTDSSFVGTPHYASPESVRAERAPDRRSDQYSMGVILYEGTTGVRPFAAKGGSFVTMAMAICAGDFAPPRSVKPELPEALERVILKAMAIDADQRFVGMRQLGMALLPFASERARIIWTPSFKSDGTDPSSQLTDSPPEVGQVTQVLAQGSGSVVAVHPSQPPSLPSHQGYSRTGPTSQPPSYPQPPPPPVMFGSTPPPHSMAPHDRTPSFGAGIHSSVQPPAKRGSGMLVAAILIGLVGVGLIGAVALRSHAESANAQAAPSSSFTVDVQSTPDSAVLELDGTSVGAGHFTRQFNRDGQQHVLRVTAPGYETLLVPFDETRPPPGILSLRASTTAPGAASVGAGGVIAPPPPPPPKTGPLPQFHPTVGSTPPKGKPDRPRTDNIDPWE